MTAFSATASQNLTAIGRLHALSETVNGFAAAAMRLKCTFHCFSFFTLTKSPVESQVCFSYLQVTTPVGFVKGRQK